MRQNLQFITCSICLLALVLLAGPGRAQEFEPENDHWELGVNLLSLFKENSALQQKTYGLIVKKKVSDTYALRFRQDLYFNTSIKPSIKGSNQPVMYYLSFDLGIEKQKKYGRFMHYYGADVVCRYEVSDITVGLGINNNAPSYSRQKGKAQTYGLSALTGGKFFFTPRLSLSLETNLSVLYEKTRNEYGSVDTNNQYLEPPGVGKTHGIYTSILPISTIYLSYYF